MLVAGAWGARAPGGLQGFPWIHLHGAPSQILMMQRMAVGCGIIASMYMDQSVGTCNRRDYSTGVVGNG